MPFQADHLFPADHPTAAGHFPGNPVIPGAVLLDVVLSAIGDGDAPCTVRSAKFLHPVRPGERMRIEWEISAKDTRFACTVAGQPVLTGSLGR